VLHQVISGLIFTEAEVEKYLLIFFKHLLDFSRQIF